MGEGEKEAMVVLFCPEGGKKKGNITLLLTGTHEREEGGRTKGTSYFFQEGVLYRQKGQ